MISGARASASFRVSPRRTAFRMTFSRPVRSGWNPAPSSRRGVRFAPTSIPPSLGRLVPRRRERSVLFPAPFFPMMPRHSPRSTEKLTESSAVKVSRPRSLQIRGSFRTHSLKPGGFLTAGKRLTAPRTSITRDTSEHLVQAPFHLMKDGEPGGEAEDGHGRRDPDLFPEDRVGKEEFPPGRHEAGEGIQVKERPEPFRNGAHRVDDGGHPEDEVHEDAD